MQNKSTKTFFRSLVFELTSAIIGFCNMKQLSNASAPARGTSPS